jgi:translation elongation factor EF-Ts
VAALVTLRTTTDFALRTDILQDLGQKLAMQAAANGVLQDTDAWVLDPGVNVRSVIDGVSEKLGEPVIVSQVHVQS